MDSISYSPYQTFITMEVLQHAAKVEVEKKNKPAASVCTEITSTASSSSADVESKK